MKLPLRDRVYMVVAAYGADGIGFRDLARLLRSTVADVVQACDQLAEAGRVVTVDGACVPVDAQVLWMRKYNVPRRYLA